MARISVLVVDDSVVIRRLVTNLLDSDPDIHVVGAAANGRIALDKLALLAPDAVTLDVEMPVLDGVATLREIRKTHPRLPVVMFSTLTEQGATATLDALAAGANDYVTKPANVGSVTESIETVRRQLRAEDQGAVRVAPRGRGGGVELPTGHPAVGTDGRHRDPFPRARTRRRRGARLLHRRSRRVGPSPGRPARRSAGAGGRRAAHAAPVHPVVRDPAQRHRPAARQRGRTRRRAGARARYIAPGDHHLTVESAGGVVRARLSDGPPENFCRPAVDVLFRSVAATFGSHALAVVLTGMGQDGARGCEDVVHHGGEVVVQDEATSVVWGMPGAVAHAGLAHAVLPIDQIAGAVRTAVNRERLSTPLRVSR